MDKKGKIFFFPFEIVLECEGVDKGPVQCFIYLLFYVICSYLFSGGGVEVVGEGVGSYSDISLVGECSRPERQRAKERSLSFQNCNFKSRKNCSRFGGDFSAHRLSSHLDASPPPAEGLGTDVGGHKVAVAHPPRSAEEVGQAVGHAGCRVAGTLLCCNAASGEQTPG